MILVDIPFHTQEIYCDDLFGDQEYMNYASEHNGLVLQYASEELKNDKQFVAKCII